MVFLGVGHLRLENIDKFSLKALNHHHHDVERVWFSFSNEDRNSTRKMWDLLNNIGLTYWSLNIRLVLNPFFLRLNKYLHGINQIFSIKKNKEILLYMNYIATVISNRSNEYIHLYWTGPPTFASNSKCMGKYSIESKNNGENIISSLHVVSMIFVSSISMWLTFNLLEHISLKK